MSFSFTKGFPVAKIHNGKFDGEILGVLDDVKKVSEKEMISRDIDFKNAGGTLFPLPNPDDEFGARIYISGPTGSGKSFWCYQYGLLYKELFPKNPIYLFSKLKKDKSIDKLDPIRILLDESILENPIDPSEIGEALVIFDDIDAIQDDKIRKHIQKFRNDLLECGRHEKIYTLNTAHKTLGGVKTQQMLLDTDSVVLFPKSGATAEIKNYLKRYAGFDTPTINKIMALNTRWICIRKIYPMIIMYEEGAFFA